MSTDFQNPRASARGAVNPITAYRCDFCKKILASSRSAERHERGCSSNPANRACKTCRRNIGVGTCTVAALPAGVMMVRHCAAWEEGSWDPEDDLRAIS